MTEVKLKTDPAARGKPWMQHVGKLKDLRMETERINKAVEEEFEQVEPEVWKVAKRD